LAAPFGDEPRIEAEDVTGGVGLDFVNPHVVNDHATRGKVNESHVPLSMREEYSCCIAACHWGAMALLKAYRYDFGSTHSRADRRATA
jgi:hypothetical protein